MLVRLRQFPPEVTMSEKRIATELGENATLLYSADRIIGKGSFGEVFNGEIKQTGQQVAVKRVLQDRRFKVC
jgi:serine/threonine protein kinase